MNQEEAEARAHGLLNVIETTYGIRIVNLETVVETITGITLDESRVLHEFRRFIFHDQPK